jgi:hypothetical protein
MDGSPAQSIMCVPIFERSDAFTFRHAHHEFPVTIAAVVFDAYGTLFDIQSVASVSEQTFPTRCRNCLIWSLPFVPNMSLEHES